ncbi:MAG: hypothetical protein CMP26_10930 [Roseibacillus sp.]|nr:hypothetical protein [Roseibacillus sp.]
MSYLSVSPSLSNLFVDLAECLAGVAASSASPGLEVLWGEGSFLLMGEIVLIGTVGYYFVAWSLVGRDRHKADKGPKQEPPAGYSPAALRYLWSIEDCPVGYDDGAFTASVVGLAGKGVVTIEKSGSTFLLHDNGMDGVKLLPDEEIVYRALFHDPSSGVDAPRGRLTLGESGQKLYGTVFRGAIRGLQEMLSGRLKRGEDYRKRNGWWVFVGVVSSLFGAGLVGMDPSMLEGRIAGNVAESVGDSVLGRCAFGAPIALFFALVVFLLFGSFTLLRRRNMEPALGLGAFGVVLGLGLLVLMRELYTDAGCLRVTAWLLFGYILNVRSANLLKQYSREGRMVQDYIEGLQTYMSREVTRASDQAYGPVMNVEHHDQLLPYAVALGRAGSWSRQFEIQLESRKEAGAPSGGFVGDLAGPEIGKTLAVNGEFHEALKLSC